MYIGKIDVSPVDTGIKIEIIDFDSENKGVIIKCLKTNKQLLILEKEELNPLIELLKRTSKILEVI